MTFRLRNIARVFDPEFDLGFKNLVVSGCSFTFNNSETDICCWPYYLRDLGTFAEVYDCSLPGAGNFHISNALQWSLLNSTLERDDTLIIVMWSGHDRDDAIMSDQHSLPYPMKFEYGPGIISAISGGAHADAQGNVDYEWQQMRRHKTPATRAVENYLTIQSTHAWLKFQGWRFVFVKYLDPKLPHLGRDFEIQHYLPNAIKMHLDCLISPIQDPYSFCLKRSLLDQDDFHPSPDGYLGWTREILLPYLEKLK